MNKDTHSSRLLNIREAATYIGCAPGTLRKWVSQKSVPFIKVGRLVRFREADLDTWLDSQRVEPQERRP